MFKLSLNNKKVGAKQVISITDESLSILCFDYVTNNLKDFTIEKTNTGKIKQSLTNLIKSKKYIGFEFELVLMPSQYQLLIEDKLKVKDSELSEALKWSIQDKVSLGVEDMLIEVIDIPQTVQTQTEGKVIVFVVSKSLIKSIINICRNAGIILTGISVADLAIATLLDKYSKKQHYEDKLKIYYDNFNGNGKIITFFEDKIYFIRDIAVNYSADNFDLLAEELERTNDYCKNNLKLDQGAIYIIPKSFVLEKKIMIEQLNNLNIKTLGIEDFLDQDISIDISKQRNFMIDLGAVV